MKISPRVCRHCGSPAKGRPCWWGIKPRNWSGDPPCVVYPEQTAMERGMSWGWWVVLIYVSGFIATFVFNIGIGPVTLGLSLLRAVVWPLFWLTGWPQGERF